MSGSPQTVAGRVEQAALELDTVYIAAVVAVGVALGFSLLFMQEPLLHDSLHNFRHSIGITCH